jgi:hypothetical protein
VAEAWRVWGEGRAAENHLTISQPSEGVGGAAFAQTWLGSKGYLAKNDRVITLEDIIPASRHVV